MMRNLIQSVIALGVSITASAATASGAGSGAQCNPKRPDSPAAALNELLAGNARWSSGKPIHPGLDASRRQCVFVEGQTPFAAILSCSDSRVASEHIFDQGVGDLFVVRNAGNSSDELAEQSLGYAAEALHVPIIIVIGHQSCGAVAGAVDAYPAKAPLFLAVIYDAVKQAREVITRRGGNPDDKSALARETIDRHVILEVRKLAETHPFKEMIAAGKLKIVGGRYDLDSGRVVMFTQ
jgi:carbonic anhydrase